MEGSDACLHWSLVDEHSIELFGSLRSRTWLGKSNVCDATALAALVVLDGDLLDWSDRLLEVFLSVAQP